VSANLARRNLSKGQQAMAMVYPEPEKGGCGKKKERVDEKSTLFSAKRLQLARSVLRYSTPLAQEVMSGKTALNDAVEVVRRYERRAAWAALLLRLHLAEVLNASFGIGDLVV
jgi:hypothetical protein